MSISPDDCARAEKLILAGRKPHRNKQQPSGAEIVASREEESVVERYYRDLEAPDLDAALLTMDFAEECDHRKKSVTLLSAYFNWCDYVGVRRTSDGKLLEPYQARFGVSVARLLSGFDQAVEGDQHEIPYQTSPDHALGWEKWPRFVGQLSRIYK